MICLDLLDFFLFIHYTLVTLARILQTSTYDNRVDGHAPSSGLISSDHCIDTLSATARGGSLVRTRLSVRVKGSFPGSYVSADSRGILPLANVGTPIPFPKPRLAECLQLGLQLGSTQPLPWFCPGPMGDPGGGGGGGDF